MKKLMFTAIMLFTLNSVPAEQLFIPPTAISNPAAQDAVKQKCKDACVIFDAEDAAALRENIEQELLKAYVAGRLKGHEDWAEAAKENPKICPKDI